MLTGETEAIVPAEAPPSRAVTLQTLREVPHDYQLLTTAQQRAGLVETLKQAKSFCFDLQTTSPDPKQARLLGLAFSLQPHTGFYVPVPESETEAKGILEEFRPALESERIEKVGHNLKCDLSVLQWHGISVQGKLFDTMIAHSLIEPELRHGMDYLAEFYLGYSPIPISKLIGEKNNHQSSLANVPLQSLAQYAAEDADVTWQLRSRL